MTSFALASSLALASTACGPSPAQIAKVEAARANEEFPIVAMQLVIVRGKRGALVLSLDKNGALRDGKEVVGAIKTGRVLGPKGEERIAIGPEGRVVYDGRRTPLRFSERDEIVSDNGKHIAIDDAGNVVFAPPMRRQRAYSFKFEGFAPSARRTALLVFLLVVLENEKEAPEDE